MSHDNQSNTMTPERSQSTEVGSAPPDRKDLAARPFQPDRSRRCLESRCSSLAKTRSDFDSFFLAARDAIAPSNLIEEIFLHDFVHLAWDNLRLRRQKTGLMIAGAHKGLAALLRAFFTPQAADALAHGWANRDQEQIRHVEEILVAAQMDMEAVMAETLSVRLEEFERVDAMTMRNEARRIAILRELEAHRAVRGRTPVHQEQKRRIRCHYQRATNEGRDRDSHRKREANRANSRLSTGPAPLLARRERRRMPEGKAYRFQSQAIRHLRLRSTI